MGLKTVKVPINVIPEIDFPLLVGCDTLRLMNVRVDPVTHSIHCRETSDLVAVSWEEHSLIQAKSCPSKVDTVSGIDESKEDQTLLQEARDSTFLILTKHLSSQDRETIWNVFTEHHKAWLRPRGGEVNVMQASFEVEGKPVKLPIWFMSNDMRVELDKQITDMLSKNVIRPSKSPWGAPPVFVQKKTGEWRMCIDYRMLNKKMIGDAYPLPLIWANLQLAAHYHFYTCLDCNWGFWNIPLDEKSKPLTAFVSPAGSYEFNVLPFGIKNSPSECQRAVDIIFGDLYTKGVLTYIDDIVIFTNTFDEHLGLIKEVLRRCAEAGLYLKLAKSEICKDHITLRRRNWPSRHPTSFPQGRSDSQVYRTFQQSRVEIIPKESQAM